MRNLRCFTFALLILVTFSTIAFAQKKDYKPGEKIEYNDSGTWVEATFVRVGEDGSQPMIRMNPTEIYPGGYERWTSWVSIRPLSAKSENKASVNTNRANNTKADDSTTKETTKDFGNGVMTQTEVLGFLQTKLGDKPFENPRRDEIKKELAEMIKARGLDFRFISSDTVFWNKLAKYGAVISEITFPLGDNYGEPTSKSWLMGVWTLGKIGAAVDYTKNNRVYRQGEIGVGNVGTLTLNSDGTYIWKSAMAQSTSGKWREATKEEMKSKGGEGIVLLKAKSGYDWIVTKDRTTTLKGEWLNISELGTRQINEYGSRNGKK